MIEIIVDIHEQDSEVAEKIASRELGACHMRHMETGDVVLRHDFYTVGLEIKRGQDFDNSLKSGRLHDQIARLTENFDFPILIIEDWHPFVGEHDIDEDIEEKRRKHAMTVRTLNRRICTYSTPHLDATVDLIAELCRDLEMKKLNVLRRPVIIAEGVSNQMKILCALPNVKETIAERILKKYKTVSNALSNLESWTEIHGIGTKKLEKIRRTLEDEEDE